MSLILKTHGGDLEFDLVRDNIILIKPYYSVFSKNKAFLELEPWQRAARLAYLYLKVNPGDTEGAARVAMAFGMFDTGIIDLT